MSGGRGGRWLKVLIKPPNIWRVTDTTIIVTSAHKHLDSNARFAIAGSRFLKLNEILPLTCCRELGRPVPLCHREINNDHVRQTTNSNLADAISDARRRTSRIASLLASG